jgi:hypothetical protein
MVHWVQQALPPKAADLYICVNEQVSYRLTGFSFFAPTASQQAPAMLLQPLRLNVLSARPVGSGSDRTLPAAIHNCSLDLIAGTEPEQIVAPHREYGLG